MKILVTGATAGIGLETARALAARGHSVWLHGRTEGTAREAADGIRAEIPEADLRVVGCDLASLEAVRGLGIALQSAALDVLVHNAGVFMREPTRTVDGYETTWAVNHLAPFLLTSLLIEGLCARPAARVINVSSIGHRSGRIHFDDVNLGVGYDGIRAYCQSKLANVLFTRELARRTRGTALVTHALHPGVIRTRLLGQTGFGGQPAQTPAMGARTSVYLATDPHVMATSGGYFVDRQRRPAKATSQQIDRQLWALSVRQTGAAMPGMLGPA